MHIELCALGFDGSYDRVAAFARQWKMDQLAQVNLASKGTTWTPKPVEDVPVGYREQLSASACFTHIRRAETDVDLLGGEVHSNIKRNRDSELQRALPTSVQV